MERTFIHNGRERPISRSSTQLSRVAIGGGNYSASDMAGSVSLQDLVDPETATLIGVVPEPMLLEGLTDNQLMVAVADGNCAALETLYDRHCRTCFGLALKIVCDPSVAEDITQEVFLKVWSRPQPFSQQRGKFISWLLTMVHHRSIDKLRAMRAGTGGNTWSLDTANSIRGADSGNASASIDALPDLSPSPLESACENETGRLVHDALCHLPEAQKEVVMLAYFEGLTQSEIAAKLDRPLGTVKTHTRSALHTLYELFSRQGLLSSE